MICGVPGRRRTATRILAQVLPALLLLVLGAARAGAGTPPPNDPTNRQRGWWETPYRWDVPAIHMCLLRGNGTDAYAQILWWSAGPDARLWKWNPGDTLSDGANFMNVPTDNSNVFCGGHSTLEDGRLMVSGGTEKGDQGIDHVNIFDPLAVPPRWQSPRAHPMVENRYYPTNTTLGDGRVLVSAGQKYQEVGIWGGEDNGTLPASAAYFGIRGQLLWVTGVPSGSPPPARKDHTIVFAEDSNVQSLVGWRYTQKMEIFGGEGASGQLFNDTWGLYRDELGTRYWAQLHPDPDPVFGFPAPRAEHAAIFTIRDSAMVIFGGRNAEGKPLDDVWRCYSNGGSRGEGRWRRVFPAGADPALARFGHSMTYDPVTARAYVFGGMDGEVENSEAWQLDLTGGMTWTALAPTGPPPPARTGHAALFDLSGYRRHILVFGGNRGDTCRADLWELSGLETTPRWTRLTADPDPANGVPAPRTKLAALFDPTFERWLLFGGDTTPTAPGGELDDVWTLKLNYPDPLPRPVWRKDPLNMPDGPRARFGMVTDPRWVRSTTPEIFYPQSDFWGSLPNAQLFMALYPHMFLLPSGKVFHPGPNFYTYLLNLDTGLWEQPAWSLSTFRGGSAVQYRPGKIMKCGDAGLTSVPTTGVIDLSGDENAAAWREVSQSSLMIPRVEHNLTLLPTGEVLVTGGLRIRTNIATAVRQPQIWNPNTEVWTDSLLLAPDPGNRDYHSTTLLLPDGRILSGGGDLKESPEDTTRYTATIYWPPYLFDANGNIAPKPVVSGWPEEISYDQTFLVHSPDADRVRQLVLLRPGAATHAFNQDQHYVPLTFAHDPGTQELVARSPEHFNIAPVGWYMLFAVDQDSVPSLGRWIHIGQSVTGSPPPGPGPRNQLQVRAFPNPFTQTATVSFFLPRRGPVTLDLFDAAGRRIRRLNDGALEAGARELYWDGRDDRGRSAPDGVYFVKLRTDFGVRTEKLVLTR